MKVEQIDREAAGEVIDALLIATEPTMMTPEQCEGIVCQAFARHRHQSRAEVVGEIVEWLNKCHANWIAERIEAKFGGRGAS